ncbi:threonine/homoserine/homoserine lactone efflux protein [Roseibium hamelinense]|uniref:Threonine/homoserine/homoserine lactone efflux protein n=1 Tax=Roseibium hamelinense TaxID=150831 RepID=A0A562T134_9HYPH|nr:LysE family translocator [Roseibium hamelinense]MTI44576.1 LysE family translocator [Roseibium hamelinense]TWI87202.1 threonine/homoserine/homoserine lactone efflux protein [Roseibium hamelinense]
MPSLELILAFATATALFAFMPGPALLFTAAQTLARGRAAGFFAVFGIHVGCYAHVIAATFGLSALFVAVPTLYLLLKITGGAYLVFLGIQMIRSRPSTGVSAAFPEKSKQRAFVDSVLVEVLNPKVAVFFIAFLPQFVSPEAALPLWVQFLILGTLVNMAFSTADIFTVFFASEVQKRLTQHSRWQAVIRWASGSILVCLGIKLASDKG